MIVVFLRMSCYLEDLHVRYSINDNSGQAASPSIYINIFIYAHLHNIFIIILYILSLFRHACIHDDNNGNIYLIHSCISLNSKHPDRE